MASPRLCLLSPLLRPLVRSGCARRFPAPVGSAAGAPVAAVGFSRRRWLSDFSAGSEWRQVPEGAILEPGLEVRFDLASGCTFARRAGGAKSGLDDASLRRSAEVAAFAEEGAPKLGKGHLSDVGGEAAGGPCAEVTWGAKVRLLDDVEAVRRRMRRRWEQDMAGFCGKVGTVTHVDGEGEVTVEFNVDGSWKTWTFNSAVLEVVSA
eukprot:TRINITY_DN60591_c0_g1_i1.p1 TRINITY_DN60591_c0_g1~~TRINITY_DN60591_c0_g1_i1.p1  ORF type:complete len:207 (-),score=37.58 TRINITY_DN60591_c0_g1_i1:197-817(-)